ncbi:MAG: amidase family protein, partial [SAR324 cluster bacterium]|nr:amidase family protein [SAR324 cluster bacterium]
MVESASLQELSGKIRGGEIRSEEVIAWAYDRIEAHDSDLNVFRSRLDRETALKKAREIDQRAASGEKLGPLAGIPVSIKDNICIQDPELNGSCASAILEDYASPYDAHVVERLKAADAIIIGKTNMDEFAMGSSTENSAYGPTLNPWDRDRVPGGSSGGAAVSVASGMVLLALGSDTGGSVRQPASLCGVTGVKPSYGSVSRYGLVAYGSSLDQIGCLAKSSEDCSYALEVIQGHDPRDSTSSDQTLVGDGEDLELQGKRFCLPETYLDPEVVDAEVIEAISEAELMLQKEGAVIEKRRLEFLRFVIPTYYILAFAEASSNLGRFDGIRYGVRSQKEANLKSLYSDS